MFSAVSWKKMMIGASAVLVVMILFMITGIPITGFATSEHVTMIELAVRDVMLEDGSIIQARYIPGQLLIGIKNDVSFSTSSDTIVNAHNRFGVTEIKQLVEAKVPIEKTEKVHVSDENTEKINIKKLKLEDRDDLEQALTYYNSLDMVSFAEPNYILSTFVAPNDPGFDEQYSYNRTNATLGWNLTIGDGSVIIGVIDTGVDWDHPDLAANIWNNTDELLDGTDTDGNGYIDDIRGFDFIDDPASCASDEDCSTEDNDPTDVQEHGTHVAGISSAVGNNSIGITGVCWNCSIMPLRAGYKLTNGDGSLPLADILQAVDYAVNNSADILTMSFGTSVNIASLEAALTHAYNNGTVLIGAAGNTNADTIQYPAGYETVIAVGATTESDDRRATSTYGSWIDIAAPGDAINSTIPDDSYGVKGGTSMAAPYISGVAGLILTRNPTLTNRQVYNILRSGVRDLSADEYIGTGLIDNFESVRRDNISFAEINATHDAQSIAGLIALLGTANVSSSDAILENYTLSYASGIYPASWTILATFTTALEEGTLFEWDSQTVTNGTYTLRLEINDTYTNATELQSIDQVLVTVANTVFSFVNSTAESANNTVTQSTNATINFSTTEATNYTIIYGNSSDNLNETNDSSTLSTNNRSIYLTNLYAGTTYFYNITVCASSGTCHTNGTYNFTTQSNIAPIVSSLVVSNKTNDSVVITWNTNEAGNTSIVYQNETATFLNTSEENISFTMDHNLTLSGLQNLTTYYYNITTCDFQSLCNTSGPYSFITLENNNPPVATTSIPINNTIVTNGSQSFTCNATDDVRLQNVSIFTNMSGGFSYNKSDSLTGTSNTTNFTLASLPDNEVIVWGCQAADNQSQLSFSSENRTINTSLPPSIMTTSPTSNQELSSSTTSTTIRVQTSEASECRLNTTDGSFMEMEAFTDTNTTWSNHTVSGLTAGTSKTYRILCQDEQNNTMYQSYTLTFSIAAATATETGGGNSGGGGGGGGGSSGSSSSSVAVVNTNNNPLPTPTEKSAETPQETLDLETSETSLQRTSLNSIRATAKSGAILEVVTASLQENPTPTPVEGVLKFLEITLSETEETLDSAEIDFSTDKEGVEKDSVYLLHYAGTSWEKLPTVFVREDNTSYYYTATTSSFSYFAIISEGLQTSPSQESRGRLSFLASSSAQTLIIAGIISSTMLGMGIIRYRRRKRGL